MIGASLRSAWLAVTRRRQRNLLTTIAVAMGSATVVTLIAVTNSSSIQTTHRLLRYESQVVTVGLPATAWRTPELALIAHIQTVGHVEAVGTLVLPQSGERGLSLTGPRDPDPITANAVIATPEGLAAYGAVNAHGTGFPIETVRQRDPAQVLLGARLAEELHLAQEEPVTVTIDGRAMRALGIVNDPADRGALATAIVLSPEAAALIGREPPSRLIQVRFAQGHADTGASQLAMALDPAEPSSIAVSIPPNPAELRARLLADSAQLVAIVTAIITAVTAFSIITTMQISVQERRREIGITRALGVPRHTVALSFFVEALLLGLLGSTVGLALGSVTAAAASRWLHWALILPPWLLGVPAAGMITGALAGSWPAFNASRTDPADLLRSA